VLEDVPMDSVDPTAPRNPVLIPRTAPATVSLAVLLLFASAGLALVCAVVLFVAASWVPDGVRERAVHSGVDAADVDAVITAVRGALTASAAATLVLAAAGGVVAAMLRRGTAGARIATLVLVGVGICCGLGASSYTAFGAHVDWTVAVTDRSDQLTGEMGRAYGEAMPGWLVGLSGGLTDLQVLGYIAVAVLLTVPASRPYFRRRGQLGSEPAAR
jgi:hypothetical protein